MPPMTKFWHCVLKDEQSVNSAAFQSLFSDILDLITTYSNPEGCPGQMHALYQDIERPSRLFMITGYPSQELNTEADKVYAEKYLPSMFQYVDHVWLRQSDIDVTSLPLEEQIVLTYGTKSSVWKDEKALGGWDIWPETRQGQRNAGESGVAHLANDEKVWVQVSRQEDGAGGSIQPPNGERVQLRKIAGK